MTNPKIVFCTTCKGRAQHLELTLLKNMNDNVDYANCSFVVLDYNSQDHLLEFLSSFASHIETGKLAVYSYKDASVFKMAHAKNMAHRCGLLEGADILVNLDADNFTGPGFAWWIAEQFQKENIYLWACMIPGDLPRGISGRIAVTKTQFLLAGGYDEKYETWGPDDKDFNLRLRRLGFEHVEIERRFLEEGVQHNNKMRFREYPHAAALQHCYDNELSTVNIHQTATIANWGNFGCGSVIKWEFSRDGKLWQTWGDRENPDTDLKPLPTRIFGIGLHKTATTSLHHALQMLGFDSAHWKGAHWAKRIWNEMQNLGASATLEKSFALSDLPIPLLYKQLDRAYPGSKFILTLRDEISWLSSVQNHWSGNNPYRDKWDTDPFTHRAHLELYGRRTFDAGVFLKRFRRHNAEVIEYFKTRPDDLLVLDVDQAHGWAELCAFLSCPIPPQDYPVKFKTKGAQC